MLAHHSPTKYLLKQFAARNPLSSRKSAVWVYEKGLTPRLTADLSGESSEYGYFTGGSTGETDAEVDERLAKNYEQPFTTLLPRLRHLLPIVNEKDKRTCALFMANLFRRSQAIKKADRQLYGKLWEGYALIASQEEALRAYAAKVSILARRSIALTELRDAVERLMLRADIERTAQQLFVDDLPRATENTASHLEELDWMLLRSSSATNFYLSDTPVISKQVDPFGQVKFGVGLAFAGVEWFVPVSPRLILRAGKGMRSSIDVSAAEVTDLNLGQVLTMSRRLYGPDYSGFINDLVQWCGGRDTYFETVFKNKDLIEGQLDTILSFA